MRALVITTIQAPTTALVAYLGREVDVEIFVVGDKKTPTTYDAPPANYLSLEAQEASVFTLSDLLPYNHYARKNLGYLAAIEVGAELIAETDDDNTPTLWSIGAIQDQVSGSILDGAPWVNVYRWFTDERIWPRGYPLELILSSFSEAVQERAGTAYCPVQQYLAAGDPDVDAIYRQTVGKSDHEFHGPPVILGRGTATPFNSQSTAWFPPAYPYMYLPSFVSFRMTDIWRSFVAQACLWAHGWHLAYHEAAVHQERNAHDLARDFQQELPGYAGNREIMKLLSGLALEAQPEAAGANLLMCYTALQAEGYVELREIPLVEAWVADLAAAVGR